DGRVLRGDGGVAVVADRGVEDDVDDVLAGPQVGGRDRLDHRYRPLDIDVGEPALLRQLAAQRLLHRLSLLHPSARQQPVGLLALGAVAEKARPPPPQEPAAADRGAGAPLPRTAEDPTPRADRSDSGSSSTCRGSTAGTARITSWAMRSPASTRNGW